MKQIIAIIRMDRMNATKRALADAGIASVTARKVDGRGKGRVDYLAATTGDLAAIPGSGPRLMPKRILWIAVPDKVKDKVVSVIMKTNQTGKPGDGKIFVRPLLDAIRVRTADRGDHAVNEQT